MWLPVVVVAVVVVVLRDEERRPCPRLDVMLLLFIIIDASIEDDP